MCDPILSICIATYQRYDILKELLEEILSVDSNEFEIIVNDDHSMDGSYEKIKGLKDKRLKVFSNSTNLGSIGNIPKLLDYGSGTYLLYLNDRDNVDPIKIPKLISILRYFKEKKIAFAKCINVLNEKKDFYIFPPGKDSFIEFACQQHHISGFVFEKNKWRSIKNREKFFKGKKHGDWPYTHIYAIMAIKNSGAVIFNDICNTSRERIDFNKVKSGFYLKRPDKRVWHDCRVQWRELCGAYEFLKTLPVPKDWLKEAICKRYLEALLTCVINYNALVSLPLHTTHYGLPISKNKFKNHVKELYNGLFLWFHVNKYWRGDFPIILKMEKITFEIAKDHFKNICGELGKSLSFIKNERE